MSNILTRLQYLIRYNTLLTIMTKNSITNCQASREVLALPVVVNEGICCDA